MARAVKQLLDLLFVPYKDAAAFKRICQPAFTNGWVDGHEEGNEQEFTWPCFMPKPAGAQLNKGPHALEFSVKATVPTRVLTDGEQAAMNDLSKIAMANAMRAMS